MAANIMLLTIIAIAIGGYVYFKYKDIKHEKQMVNE